MKIAAFISLLSLTILFSPGCNLDEIPDDIDGGISEVSFMYNNSCSKPYEVDFTNTSDLTGNYFWNFGDVGSENNTSTLENPSHQYSIPGTYSVELSVDSSGVVVNKLMDVEVISITYETTFGGGIMDSASSIVKAHDEGYFITGFSKSKGNDILIYKTNLCNDELLYSTVGGSGSNYGHDICQSNDGGYIICGEHQFFGSSGFVVKLNASGNSVNAWEELDVKTNSAVQLENNSIIVAGRKKVSDYNSDAYLWQLASNMSGASSFYNTSTQFTDYYSQVIDITNGVAAVGTIWVGWGYRICFVSTNGSFALPFTFSIEKIVGDNSVTGESLAMSGDGGYVFTGWYDNVFDQDPRATYLKKISGTGAELWERDFVSGTGIIGQHEPSKVIATEDGGFLILGNHKMEVNSDVFILKTDSNGNYLWDKSFGGNGKDVGNDIIELEDGGFLIVGYTESFNTSGEEGNVYIIKTDENGEVQ